MCSALLPPLCGLIADLALIAGIGVALGCGFVVAVEVLTMARDVASEDGGEYRL